MSSTAPMNVPNRHSGSRAHSHTVSLGALNSSHRVTRRKSMTSNNLTAVAAAVQGMDGAYLEAMASAEARGLLSKPENGVRRAESSSTIKPAMSTPQAHSATNYQMQGSDSNNADNEMDMDSAVVDGQTLAESSPNISKPRNRRASDGAYLTKSDGKRASGELRCEKCGKGYKHSSCLTKHLLVPLHNLHILPNLDPLVLWSCRARLGCGYLGI